MRVESAPASPGHEVTDSMSTPRQPFPAAARLVRAEHVVMAGAALALVVLVALPLAFLVVGSVTSEGGVTLAHFRDALSSRLYVQALRNSLILGAGRWRRGLAITGPLVAPAVLSGALVAFVNAIALFGSQAIVGLPGRVVTLPTRIYALFDYPPYLTLMAVSISKSGGLQFW